MILDNKNSCPWKSEESEANNWARCPAPGNSKILEPPITKKKPFLLSINEILARNNFDKYIDKLYTNIGWSFGSWRNTGWDLSYWCLHKHVNHKPWTTLPGRSCVIRSNDSKNVCFLYRSWAIICFIESLQVLGESGGCVKLLFIRKNVQKTHQNSNLPHIYWEIINYWTEKYVRWPVPKRHHLVRVSFRGNGFRTS